MKTRRVSVAVLAFQFAIGLLCAQGGQQKDAPLSAANKARLLWAYDTHG